MNMLYRLAELERRLGNVIRMGTVLAVDPQASKCKVQLDTELITTWLPWLTQRAGLDAATWWAPSLGEQVVILSPGGELSVAVVLPSLNQALMPPPGDNPAEHVTRYGIGTMVKVNVLTGAVEVVTPGPLKATALSAEITAPTVQVTGAVTITGPLTVTGPIACAAITGTGALTAPSAAIAGAVTAGSVTASGDVQGGGKSLMTHTHLYNPGPGSSTPTAPPT
jgi:phage baseplate assembly protein V